MGVTLKDIGKNANVSAMAVSAAVNNTDKTRISPKKRQMIKALAEEMGYRPNIVAQSLSGGKSRLLGVILDSQAPDACFKILRSIEEVANSNGYRLMISEQHDSVNNVMDAYLLFKQYNAEGVILLSHDYYSQKRKLAGFFKDKTDIVLLGKNISAPIPYLDTEFTDAVRDGFCHFIKKGRRKIGFLMPELPHQTVVSRIKTYKDIADELGIQLHMYQFQYSNDPDAIKAKMEKAVVDFIEGEKIDAAMCLNDFYALHLISASAARGIKVPEDLAVIGWDNSDFCNGAIPALASIDNNLVEQGREIVIMLLQRINGKLDSEFVKVKSKLKLRESAG
jgi:LacI family transcriptional regulator